MSTSALGTTIGPVPVPQPDQIRDMFQSLTGLDVEVGPADPVVPGGDPAAVAVYVTDERATGAVVACDLPLAAAAAAALGLVPVPEMDAAVSAGKLSADLGENFHEVVNVLCSVFNAVPAAPDLQLAEVHSVGEQLSADVGAMLRYVVRRLDLRVEIAGYGGGRLSIVAIG